MISSLMSPLTYPKSGKCICANLKGPFVYPDKELPEDTFAALLCLRVYS